MDDKSFAQQELDQERQEQKRRERRQQEQDALRRNTQRMEQSDKFQHIDSAHLDMSKDGIGKNKKGAVGKRHDSDDVRKSQLHRISEKEQPSVYQLLRQQEQRQYTTSSQFEPKLRRYPAAATTYTPDSSQKHNSSKNQTEINRSRLAREAQLSRIATAAGSGATTIRRTTSSALHSAAQCTKNDVLMGTALLTGSLHGLDGAMSRSNLTGNDVLIGLDRGYHIAQGAAAISRSVLCGHPAARLQMQVRNPLGINSRQDALNKEFVRRMERAGRITHNPRKIQHLSRLTAGDLQREIAKELGENAALLSASDSSLRKQMSNLLASGGVVKKRIKALESLDGPLSPSQRKELLLLKKRSKAIGKEISAIKVALVRKNDLRHLQSQAVQITKRAQIKQKPKQMLKHGVLHAATSALMQDDNTQGLVYGARISTNPHVIHAVKSSGRLAGRVMTAPIKTTLNIVAPDWQVWVQESMKSVRTAVQRPFRRVGRAIRKAVPKPVKQSVKELASVPTGIRNRFYAAQSKVLQSKFVLPIRRNISKFTAAVQRFVSAFKGIAIKAIAIVAAITMVIMIAGTVITSSAGGISGVILSPETSSKGKIDLTPYAEILKGPNLRFLGQTREAQQKYKKKENVTVKTTYAGTLNNTREILSMMAVRFKQNLDVSENPDIRPYLTFLYDITHDLSVLERDYNCSGCKQKKEYVYTPDPETGEISMELQLVTYCPGHKDVHITVTVRGFNDIFSFDSYVSPYGGDEEWEGWTEENRDWCKTIYDQDWSELYTGLSVMQGLSLGSVTTSEDAQKIWDYLYDFIGNPYGVAGLMGNLQAESGLSPGNMENVYEGDLGLDDMSYTQAVDTGVYPNFATDSVGYGLAQWTVAGRKAHLLSIAAEMGVSVGSLDAQLALLKAELNSSFAPVLEVLRNARDVQEASNCVLFRFEAPLDQSDAVQEWRASLGEYFFNRFVYGNQAEADLTLAQQRVCQVAMHSESYGISAEAGYCQRWAAYVYAAAGFPLDSSGSAYDSGIRYGVSSDFSVIPPGAAVYGYSSSQYGHVGIYVGNGLVYHNIGGVAVDTLADWISKYRGFAWGWEAGTDLTTQE